MPIHGRFSEHARGYISGSSAPIGAPTLERAVVSRRFFVNLIFRPATTLLLHEKLCISKPDHRGAWRPSGLWQVSGGLTSAEMEGSTTSTAGSTSMGLVARVIVAIAITVLAALVLYFVFLHS